MKNRRSAITSFIILLLSIGIPLKFAVPDVSVALYPSFQDDVTYFAPNSADSIKTDTNNPADTLLSKSVVPDDSIAVDFHESPYVLLSEDTLSVTRENDTLKLSDGSALHVNDIIETRSNQFAVIVFPPDAQIIVHPASKIMFKSPSTMHLFSADVHIESGSTGTVLPDTVTCFDTRVTHSDDRDTNSSFMVQCRGHEGIILASYKGAHQLVSGNKSYRISEGGVLTGRVSSSDYMESPLPDKPVVSDSGKIVKSQPSDTTYQHRLLWQPVSMTDQYLLHVTQTDTVANQPVHWLIYQGDCGFPTDTLSSGSYTFRVAAIDYYGVMSKWSDPFFFER